MSRKVGNGALLPCPPRLRVCVKGGHAALCLPYTFQAPSAVSRKIQPARHPRLAVAAVEIRLCPVLVPVLNEEALRVIVWSLVRVLLEEDLHRLAEGVVAMQPHELAKIDIGDSLVVLDHQ